VLVLATVHVGNLQSGRAALEARDVAPRHKSEADLRAPAPLAERPAHDSINSAGRAVLMMMTAIWSMVPI